MNIEHKELAAGRWAKMSYLEQMANVGSEVERAINWREKNNADYALRAGARALELLDLTLDCAKGFARLKETARTREIFADYFYGDNCYQSTNALWRKYFLPFAVAARRK
jgi:hypothetical protein